MPEPITMSITETQHPTAKPEPVDIAVRMLCDAAKRTLRNICDQAWPNPESKARAVRITAERMKQAAELALAELGETK